MSLATFSCIRLCCSRCGGSRLNFRQLRHKPDFSRLVMIKFADRIVHDMRIVHLTRVVPETFDTLALSRAAKHFAAEAIIRELRFVQLNDFVPQTAVDVSVGIGVIDMVDVGHDDSSPCITYVGAEGLVHCIGNTLIIGDDY